ncbi:MAG: ATP-dependent helicase HrpB [Gemmatimonadota bacterium]
MKRLRSTPPAAFVAVGGALVGAYIPPMQPLPIDDAVPALHAALADAGAAVLVAPPGAGKTTRVPLALLDAPWLAGRRILMLEPRRLAARAAAGHMARLLDEEVGGTVGYRVRMDTQVSGRTRIEVVTEGVVTRLLQADPALEGVGALLFDEFHERSLHADLGLALALQARALLRPDLRVVVMSATLDAEPVATLLDGAPVVCSEGRDYPVETHWLGAPVPRWRVAAPTAAAVRQALAEHEGDVLAFLPGAGEIRRTEALLREAGVPAGAEIHPLFGDLPRQAQDAAIAPSPPGRRKVVLATAIAETSLTIEGVRVVVDAGLARAPRFDARTGMTRLETLPVSRASADQRRGRAGRVAPGVCYRLWGEAEERGLVPHAAPEIMEADLTPLALELAVWGVADPGELRWLDPPPAGAFAQARELLAELDALDAAGAVTARGRRMAALPLHPRLAHMLLEAGGGDALATACRLAALLAERDVLRGGQPAPGSDVRLRLELLGRIRGDGRGGGHLPSQVRGARVEAGAVRRAAREAADLERRVRRLLAAEAPGAGRGGPVAPHGPDAPRGAGHDADPGPLLALAYPDRVARRRGGRGRFLLRNGRGAALEPTDDLADQEWLVAPELGGHGAESRIWLAAPLAGDEVERLFGEHMVVKETVHWEGERLRATRAERLGAIVVREGSHTRLTDSEAIPALLAAIRAHGLELLSWGREAERTRQRMAFLHALQPDWPDVSDAALLEGLEAWLAPWLAGVRGAADLRRLDLGQILLAAVPYPLRARLDELAPTHVEVPSGSRIAVDYGDSAAPILAVRLQEMFGLTDTPRIGGGKLPLTLHLLSPARRPVQVTRDLASFWRSGYFEVRKDLRGRYPKHYWPEDPLRAEATKRVKPRR